MKEGSENVDMKKPLFPWCLTWEVAFNLCCAVSFFSSSMVVEMNSPYVHYKHELLWKHEDEKKRLHIKNIKYTMKYKFKAFLSVFLQNSFESKGTLTNHMMPLMVKQNTKIFSCNRALEMTHPFSFLLEFFCLGHTVGVSIPSPCFHTYTRPYILTKKRERVGVTFFWYHP